MNQLSCSTSDAEVMREKRRTGEKLLHMVKIHEETNELCIGVCLQFKKKTAALLNEDDELTIEAKHSRLYIQGEKLLHRPETSAVTLSMLELFEKLGVFPVGTLPNPSLHFFIDPFIVLNNYRNSVNNLKS